MDAILARILAVPLDFPIQIRNGESVRQGQAAIAFEARDDVARRCIHVWTAAMACELELLTVSRDRHHNRLCRFLASLQGGRRQNATDDHAGIHVPGLRLETDLDGDSIIARKLQRVVKRPKSLYGERARGLKKHFEDAGAPAPSQRFSFPSYCLIH